MRKNICLLGICLLLGAGSLFAQQNEQYKNADPKELVKRTDLTEQRLSGIQRYFEYELKDAQKGKEMLELILQKYPKGETARLTAYHKVTQVKALPEFIKASENFLQEFPYNEWKKGSRRQEFIYYSIHRELGSAYMSARNFDKLVAFCTPLNFKTENEIYRWNIMRAFVFRLVGYDTLATVSTALIDELVKKVDDRSYEEAGVFNPEQAAANAREQLDNELNTHISLLYALKRYAKAKDYFSYLSEKGAFGSADLNRIHLDILRQTGDNDAMLPFLENCAKANAMTAGMTDTLKMLFTEKNKTPGAFDTYLASLKSGKEAEELKAYVKEHLTNQEYVPFALEDPSGKLVRSSDWGDKIVVLDFWATWCKPCISAFPGMQMLVDKYASDPGVAIYMVGTMQNGNYKQKSEGYVKQEGYRFNLLHDGINKSSGSQDAVFRTFVPFFNSSAIPRKVILKDGVMRYTAEGYSGSPSKLVDELSYAIELLKAEK
ncbi:thiol-disulfide isomerase/thioredoxin [Chitinophaga terrae (ex Kim and Jung 2007)]|uniref:TlpA disulfide reductase family protein n=1 Tax=Chitinophaga terrae (ex Kim and Jung 2007) TaxID=408074 RepID=UPI002789DB08|nr:TlpA disulfide reductase family protein [Chitinophaga terrae (ex Kim and Jung 2007)]MDQ0107250.1 thiol-disulfide isomerase/thioredoxin [Chitinophaga terrae (ex Kim and Jung 2007)]